MEPIELTERLGRWSSGRGPLHVLLAARLRALIGDGDLPPGTALPPDRQLAALLAVGRSTVVAAYELLRAEGRIVRRQGSGTRVAGTPAPPVRDTGTPVFLHLLEPRDGVILLACAAPAAPPPQYAQACAEVLPRLAAITDDIGYYPAGHPALRRAIATYYTGRGVPTEPGQIVVTGGGQQALSLLARAFVRPGERVLVEVPTYPGALEALREEAAVLRPLPVGLAGFEAAVRKHRPCLAYAIPTYHNPTGAVLPALHRRRLAVTAAAAGIPLVDDEVLYHLGFPGEPHPPPSLAAYAPDGVISVGSLSKIVWGGLRIGWIRAPVPVINRLARLRAVYDLGGNVLAQLAAAELVPQLDTLRRRQAEARQAGYHHLRAQLARHLPDWRVPAVRGGQTLWIRLPRGDGVSFGQAAIRHGVAVLPGTALDASGGSADYLRLHFAAAPDVLTEAVRRLAAAWRDYDPPKTRVSAAPALAV